MNLLVFVFAAVALLGAHLLRTGGGGARLPTLLSFIGGLVAAIAVVKLAVGAMGLGRTTDFDRVVNHAVAVAQADQGAPLIVFSGASYSRNALDDARLTEALRAFGFPHRAINLSLEAASLPEREAHLEALLERLETPPDVVFIEVAYAFDQRPAQFFNNSKFTARGIEQFDVRTSAWTLFGLAQGGCGGVADCVKSVGFTGAHGALNLLNVGLVARGEPASAAGQLAAFDPMEDVRVETSPDERLNGLLGDTLPAPTTGPKWIASLRAMNAARLRSQGVGVVGYYFPPVIAAEKRAYATGLCLGELASAPCISPDDPDLLAALTGDVWFDPDHLKVAGANTYTDWLAAQLVTSGILERDMVATP